MITFTHVLFGLVGLGAFGGGYYVHYRFGSKLASASADISQAVATIKKDV